MHAFRFFRPVLQPRLFAGKRQDRRQPLDDRITEVIDNRQCRLALFARWRLAIERILANIEVERRQFGVHELRQQGDDLAIVIGFISLAHVGIDFGQAVQHQALKLGHVLQRNGVFLRIEMRQRAEHPAQRVAQLAITVRRRLHDCRPKADVVGRIA